MEQINEADIQNKKGGVRLKKRKITPLKILAVMAGVLAVLYLGLCIYAETRDTFYPNYFVNGIELSGLTAEQAQEKLETEFLKREITLVDAGTQEELAKTSVEELGYTEQSFAGNAQSWLSNLDEQAFLKKGWVFFCYAAGKYPGGWYFPDLDDESFLKTTTRLAEEISRETIHGAYELEEQGISVQKARDGRSVTPADLALLRDMTAYRETYRVAVSVQTSPANSVHAQDIYDALAGEMENARYDGKTKEILPEKIGVSFDVSAAQQLLDQAQPGETVKISAEISEPTVTAEELEKVLFRDVLGEYKTHVSGTAARISNVKLSAASINNYVMNSGDVFSYNEAVGQRTAANGYMPAPAYVRGETVDEIGGGICQTSSTLYLACLLGNLEITERYAHRYVPAYVPWGMDATVSWGGPDYKFTNNTDYPIKIVTSYANGYVTIKILGTNVSGITAKMTNEVLSETKWETVYEEDPTLAPGTPETVKTTPYTGYKVKTYQHFYDANGKLISSEYEASSDYKVRNKVIVRPPAAAGTDVPATGTEEVPVVEGEASGTTDTPVEPDISEETGAILDEESFIIVVP